MGKIIKKVPVPMAGLMLGLAALGNLIQSYGNLYRNILGAISGLLLILLLMKISTDFPGVKESLNNPVVASVFPTLSMGITILSTYVKPYRPVFAYGMWLIGLLSHMAYMVYFTKRYVLDFNIKKVFPSWFIVYVGIAAGSVTASAYNHGTVGKYLFYFALATYILLLPLVLYRVIRVKEIPEAALPTIAIFAAPASLCLAGYMNSFEDKNMALVGFLATLSLIMLGSVLLYMPRLLRLPFYPSYSAYTFPFAISGISIKLTNGFLAQAGSPISWLRPLVQLEEILALILVLYVLVKYIQFLIAPPKSKAAKA